MKQNIDLYRLYFYCYTICILYFQYEDLSKMVVSVQSYLTKTREGLLEAINRLELQVTKILMKIEYIIKYICLCVMHII